MGRNRKYGAIVLTAKSRLELEKLVNSLTAEYRKVQCAKIILMSADGMKNSEIAVAIGAHRNTVVTFVNKYIAAGMDYAMNDSACSGSPNAITDEEKAWVTNITCMKPKDLGYAWELWTYRRLRDHIRSHCAEAGYSGLEYHTDDELISAEDIAEREDGQVHFYALYSDVNGCAIKINEAIIARFQGKVF